MCHVRDAGAGCRCGMKIVGIPHNESCAGCRCGMQVRDAGVQDADCSDSTRVMCGMQVWDAGAGCRCVRCRLLIPHVSCAGCRCGMQVRDVDM